MGLGASPHTRGWTLRAAPVGHRLEGFPAHAGMDPTHAHDATPLRGLPRTRGDGPRSGRMPSAIDLASPHTRGWTAGARRPHRAARGFPAHAGMDPRQLDCSAEPARLPRTRGDGPLAGAPAARRSVASPHTRGWTRYAQAGRPAGRGFPAHAGMDPHRWPYVPVPAGLPRTRGDGPCSAAGGFETPWASPHTRGWTPDQATAPALQGGFPAHAGMDPCAA